MRRIHTTQRHATKSFALIVLALILMPAARLDAHGNGELPPGAITRGVPPPMPDTGDFINFETPPVHPLDINSAGTLLAACNTPDNRLEVFAINGTTGALAAPVSIPVGFAPVSARFRTDTEVWVVNHISDTVTIVDLSLGRVVKLIRTSDEPADVVFVDDAGLSETVAAVSCSREDLIEIYSLAGVKLGTIRLDGEDPRALATDGETIYAAIFESGNGSTILGGGSELPGGVPPNVVSNGSTPYGGQNPPRHTSVAGDGFKAGGVTVQRSNLPAPPPPVGLIVRKDGGGAWRDDNGSNWSQWVSGANASASGRFTGWDLLDNDIGALTSNNGVPAVDNGFGDDGYVTRRMNIVMALGVNPADGSVVAVGTDATNEIRFEPNITGTFTRVMVAIADGTDGSEIALVDMNEEHLAAAQGGDAYEDGSVPQTDRDKSIGDPRGIAFDPAGARIYVSGMGSNNVVVLDAATGERLGGTGHTIDFGPGFFGPTGLAHHPTLEVLYCLNTFHGSVKVIDTTPVGAETVSATVKFFDPTPAFINTGRVHFYGTHENSGLGQIACASCHVDGRMDRLAWDLGDPAGAIKQITLVSPSDPGPDQHNLLFGSDPSFGAFHPMKGPMTTQTLQDIIGKEPHHWRGDRNGIEQFAGAWDGLQGADDPLNATKMQEFENFLSTIHFPPNPFRALDGSLPGGPKFFGVAGNNPTLPLPHFVGTGGVSSLGTPLPNGNAWNGFINYILNQNDGSFRCVECHTLPIGAGSIQLTNSGPPLTQANQFQAIDFGPLGESHQALVNIDQSSQHHFKTPQMRNQIDKEGFYLNQGSVNADFAKSRAGFGLAHDGAIDGLPRFLTEPVFSITSAQELADMIAFTLCVAGDGFTALMDLPGSPDLFLPPAAMDHSGHTALGRHVVLENSTTPAELTTLLNLANAGHIELVVFGVEDGQNHGYAYQSGSGPTALFLRDRTGASLISQAGFNSFAGPGNEFFYLAVPDGAARRAGIDRDMDNALNQDEVETNSDFGNPNDNKWVNHNATNPSPTGAIDNPFKTIPAGVTAVQPSPGKFGVVHIQAGNYPPITVNKRLQLRAKGGLVRIGT
jgi:DNA-binding beta-propeller fold protein YncE